MPSTPTTLCRQNLALKLIDRTGGDPEPSRFLEIGTGEGRFLLQLTARGYKGLSIDVSVSAIEHAQALLQKNNINSIEIRCDDLFKIKGNYPLVFAFEVLEHIEDDIEALKKIRDTVAPGGRFFFSVPAHKHLWGPSDEIVGHIRRYERNDLISKMVCAGFQVDIIWSVAVPVANAFLALSSRLNRIRMASGQAKSDLQQRTESSGLDRVVGVPNFVYDLLFNRFTMAPAFLLQRAFLNTNIGTGFIGVARPIS